MHQLAPNLAYVVAPLAANFFLARYSWRTAFEVYGAASIVLGLIFLLPPRKWAASTARRPAWPCSKAFSPTRAIWTLILLFGLSLGVNQGVFAMLPLYLSAERGLDHDWANSLLSLSRAAAFAAPLAAGWVSDRYGLKKTLLVVVSASGLTLLFLALAPSSWLGPALVLQAISCVCFFPLGFVALSQITRPEVRNVAVAVTVPFGHLIGAGLVPDHYRPGRRPRQLHSGPGGAGRAQPGRAGAVEKTSPGRPRPRPRFDRRAKRVLDSAESGGVSPFPNHNGGRRFCRPRRYPPAVLIMRLGLGRGTGATPCLGPGGKSCCWWCW